MQSRSFALTLILGAGITSGAFANVAIFGGPTVVPTTNGSAVVSGPMFSAGGYGVGLIANDAHTGWRYERWDTTGHVDGFGDFGPVSNNQPTTPIYGLSRTGVAVGAFAHQPAAWLPGSSTATVLPSYNANATTWNGLARGIDDHGTIIGYTDGGFNGGGTRIVRWSSPTSAPTVMPGPTSSFLASNGIAVAPNGVTVEMVETGTSAQLIRWSADGTTYDVLDPAPYNFGIKVASSGAVLSTGAPAGSLQNYRWSVGSITPTNLQPATPDEVFATDINDASVVVGYGTRDALRWDAGSSTAVVLPRLPGASASSGSAARAINNSGSIVGESVTQNSQIVASLWTSAGAIVDLNTLLPANTGWTTLARAWDIDDAGWIVGNGTYDADGSGPVAPVIRLFSLLVPSAGTYGFGDADFDGKINFSDLVILAQHYDQSTGGSALVGDFDLSGTVNFADLVTLAQHYQGANSSVAEIGNAAFADDWALAQSLVPEPAIASELIALVALPRCRRRA